MRFCRLNLGPTSPTQIFHEELRGKLRNISGGLNINDNVIVDGKDSDDHVRALKANFQVIKRNNITLPKTKSEFNKLSIKFFFLKFSADGFDPYLEEVTSSEEADGPKIKDELRSLSGMINFSFMFIEIYFLLLLQNLENHYINKLSGSGMKSIKNQSKF